MPTTVIALILAVVSTGIHQFEGVAIKKYNSKHNKGGFIFTALISLFAMLFFFITDRGGLNFPPEMIPYGIAAGALYCMASILTYFAFGCGSFVLTNLFLSYSLVFSVGYGFFWLKESAGVLTYIGLAIMPISIFMVRGQRRDGDTEESVKPSLKWVVCVALSVIGSGMFGVMQKLQQVRFEKSCDNEFMIVSLGFSAATLLAVGIIMNGKDLFYILRYGGLYASLAGVSNGATNLLNMAVNAMIPITVAAPTRSGVKIVISFLIARFVFKEKLAKRQIVGVVLGAAALILLNLKI